MTSLSAKERTSLREAIDARTARCSVIGLGFIGSTLLDAVIEAGFRAVGYDRSNEAVSRSRCWMQDRHPDKPGRWSISANPESLANADIIVVAVRLPVSADGLVEAMSPVKQMYGMERLRRALEKGPSEAQALLDRAVHEVQGHVADAPQFDDTTIVCVGLDDDRQLSGRRR